MDIFDWAEKLVLLLLGSLVVMTAGCVTLETQEEIAVIEGRDVSPVSRKGVYHKVQAGETLWRIAKTYNAPIKEITRVNNIPPSAKIEKNQLIFIPEVDEVKDIPIDVDKAENEFIWPIKGQVIKYFNQRQGDEVNKGIDIRAQDGDMVKAARTGRVVFADYLSGYGYTVILDHSDGLCSVYARNSKLLVELDQLVLRNMNIAQVGRENNLAYLHFQIRKKAIEDNPLYYLP